MRLDHVALWVADRDSIAEFATAHLGMHEIDRTEKFTLIGSDARRGKLTLFAAEGPRDPGPLRHVAFRVSSFGAALSRLPTGIELEPSAGRVVFDVAEQLQVGLVEATTPVEYDLDHVTLAVPDPEASAAAWQLLGFHPARPLHGVVRVGVAGAYVELVEGDATQPERPLLNHLAVLVDSAEDLREQAVAAGAEVDDVVDAENTYAVFVTGPDGVRLEYVEHKPSFSLV